MKWNQLFFLVFAHFGMHCLPTSAFLGVCRTEQQTERDDHAERCERITLKDSLSVMNGNKIIGTCKYFVMLCLSLNDYCIASL